MKPLPVYFYLIVLLIGGLITRECVTGSLQKTETTYAAWLEEITIPNVTPEITLITADTAGQLTALDVSLFLRAAIKFHADVAAIAAYDFAPGDEDLLRSVLTRESDTAVVAGALLTDAAGSPVNFQTANWRNASTLPNYAGARSNLPANAEATFGFFNLPGNENAEAVPVLARWEQQTVTSFSFACLTQYLRVNGIKLLPSVGNSLVFSNQNRLALGPDATVKILPEEYSKVTRYSLGDLLIAAEKTEQDAPANAAVVESIRDHLVVLAPAPSAEELAAGSFTIGQFQALCVASLVSQMHRLSLGMWIWWVPFIWFFPWMKLSERWTLTDQLAGLGLVAAFYGLFSGTIAKAFGLLLPGIPALAWFVALLVVILVRRKSASV